MWLVLGLFAHNLNLESLIATGVTASFLAIVAMGQMLVVTTGRAPSTCRSQASSPLPRTFPRG